MMISTAALPLLMPPRPISAADAEKKSTNQVMQTASGWTAGEARCDWSSPPVRGYVYCTLGIAII